MMKMAINQNIMGQVFIVGQGPDGEATLTSTRSNEQEPYRIIDGPTARGDNTYTHGLDLRDKVVIV
jgi:hypothetical protein